MGAGNVLFVVIVFGIILLIAGAGLFCVHFFRGQLSRDHSTVFKFRGYSHEEMERLKEKGLLTDEEAKRLSMILAQQTIEELEKQKQPKPDKPDIQTLLADAEQLRKQNAVAGESSKPEENA